MSYHIISSHATSCRVKSCHVTSCHVKSCLVMSCHAVPYHGISYHIISYHIRYYLYKLLSFRSRGVLITSPFFWETPLKGTRSKGHINQRTRSKRPPKNIVFDRGRSAFSSALSQHAQRSWLSTPSLASGQDIAGSGLPPELPHVSLQFPAACMYYHISSCASSSQFN